VAEDP